ncbi:hypothetical protein D4Q71_16140 [Rhodopseudomonas palustris]|nr:hypothetical protein B1S06_15560 [Rhodopseudomonas palustris]RJF63324.1 hypothetical protein D4Q71_16140 [Rhodopseudomonas palustris]
MAGLDPAIHEKYSPGAMLWGFLRSVSYAIRHKACTQTLAALQVAQSRNKEVQRPTTGQGERNCGPIDSVYEPLQNWRRFK